jgi:response regulator of citrate/malate metabolism
MTPRIDPGAVDRGPLGQVRPKESLTRRARIEADPEFERDILRDRVKAGSAQARKEGRPHGRPLTVAKYIPQVRALAKKGLNKSAIARRLGISRTSVRRFLAIRIKSPRRARGESHEPDSHFSVIDSAFPCRDR